MTERHDLADVSAAWEAHRIELFRYLRHRGVPAEDADDLVQEAFVRALRLADGFDVIRHPRGWLFQVTKNLLLDRQRSTGSELSIELTDDPAVEVTETAPVDALARCMPRVLADLPRADSEILVQCDLQGVTQADFARMHEVSLPAVKSRIQRARRRLRERLITVCRIRFDASGKVCCFSPRA